MTNAIDKDALKKRAEEKRAAWTALVPRHMFIFATTKGEKLTVGVKARTRPEALQALEQVLSDCATRTAYDDS